MTVTNYQGEARAYLEKLIEACGAKFTRNMTTANTHLIAASKNGEKCKHAHDWGIDIVNHLWLEETYAKWQVQSVTVPRYTHFPPTTNLTEIVDKTEIQEEGIVDFYMPPSDEDDEMPDTSHVSGTLATGSKGQAVQSSYANRQERIETRTPAPSRKAHDNRDPYTPAASELGFNHPPPSSKRKAAEKAAHKLHTEIMPDAMLWEKKERHRKRIPEESPSQAVDNEKKRKQRESEEKENILDIAPKKIKRNDDVKEKKEGSSNIILLITGAAPDFITTMVTKVNGIHLNLLTARNCSNWE
jgi:hypothetical protein